QHGDPAVDGHRVARDHLGAEPARDLDPDLGLPRARGSDEAGDGGLAAHPPDPTGAPARPAFVPGRNARGTVRVMSEKRDLWVPVLVILAGLGVCAWDGALGRGLFAAAAALTGLAGGGGTLALTLRKHGLRAAGLAAASILFLAALSPAFEGSAGSIAP